MVSKEQKRASLHEKLQILRTLTHSQAVLFTSNRKEALENLHALRMNILSKVNKNLLFQLQAKHKKDANKKSIIADASAYIKDLKQKISKLNQEIACVQDTTSTTLCEEPSPLVSVEVLQKGFLIGVFMDKNIPGLLASILKAFDVLGLNVLEARASCAGSFRLKAVGGEDEREEVIDAHTVEQAVMEAIRNCPGN